MWYVYVVIDVLVLCLVRVLILVGKLIVLVGIVVELGYWVGVLVFWGVDVEIVWNLEFLCEGFVVYDIFNFDCIVFGV